MLDFVDWLIMKSPPALASKFHVEYKSRPQTSTEMLFNFGEG